MGIPLSWAGHRVFTGPESSFIFQTEDASLYSITPEALDTLRKWRVSQPIVIDQAAPHEREVLEGLRDARILLPSVREASQSVRLNPDDVPLGTLVLEVAQDCNLRCTYCYAEGGTYGSEPCLIDVETALRAVRYLFDNSGDRESVTLIFFGGEPLLNMEAVKAATEEALRLSEKSGKKVNFSLTTNGTLLTQVIVDFLHENRVAVALSLDGPSHIHDRNRPDAQGRGTYDAIVAKLALLLKDSPVPVAARVTLPPDQWDSVEEVFDHLMGLGLHEVGIAPASPVTKALIPTPEEEAALLEGFAALVKRFKIHAQNGRVMPFSNILDLLGRLHIGQTKSISCGAGYGYLAVDAKGSLFPCHRLAGEEGFCVGDLEDGADNSRISSCLGALDEGRRESCSSCWAKSLCAGGCHYENHLRENLLALPRGTSCKFIRAWLNLGMKTYAEMRTDGAIEQMGKRLKNRAQC